MTEMKTSKYISTVVRNSLCLIITFLSTMTVSGQTLSGLTKEGNKVVIDSTMNIQKPEGPTKWIPQDNESDYKTTFFQGFTLSVDLIGAGMQILGDYGNMEAALRLNLKNTYFPIAELGYAKCDITDDDTNITFKDNAPYIRIGFDYNILKDKLQDNKLFVGFRYGLSKYDYDISGAEMTDPIWGGSENFHLNNISTTSQWLELCFGCQVKIVSNFHMGWSIRYKSELHSTKSDYSKPYYIPGYGTTVNSSCWGGTYNLIFDLNWGKKHGK